jgi:hypothetical protein
MIFFNNQLMKDESQTRLFIVTNPIKFVRYEDHEAALQLQLYDLIERAIEEKEDPIALIEGYLGMVYNGGQNIADIASFLLNTDHVNHAMHLLRENWQHKDSSLPDESLLYGGEVNRDEAVGIYSGLTLRTYLETLSRVYTYA